MAKKERIEIKVFWHVYMVNDYIDIVKEQMALLIDSGLYERADNVYIGCIGSLEDIVDVHEVIKDYDKITIRSHSTDPLCYEFLTLCIIEDLSSSNFYGFYMHTKGCSYPGNTGGKYWRDYMQYYNVTLWRDAVRHLDVGYDTYGVKLLSANDSPSYRLHYSGNFFWFFSGYSEMLIDIAKLDTTNRFEAETWICSANPIAATACQVFVDYDTEGVFEPFKIESNE